MKKTNVLCCLLLAFIVLMSCNKDDDEAQNHFSYNGTIYNLDKGFLYDYGKYSGNIYNYELVLTSSQINPSSNTGKGEFLIIDIYTTSTDGLDSGTYLFSNAVKQFVFTSGEVGIDVNVSQEDDFGKLIDINGGTLDVDVSDEIVTLKYDFTTKNNRTVTGNFKGKLTLL